MQERESQRAEHDVLDREQAVLRRREEMLNLEAVLALGIDEDDDDQRSLGSSRSRGWASPPISMRICSSTDEAGTASAPATSPS